MNDKRRIVMMLLRDVIARGGTSYVKDETFIKRACTLADKILEATEDPSYPKEDNYE